MNMVRLFYHQIMDVLDKPEVLGQWQRCFSYSTSFRASANVAENSCFGPSC